MNKLNVTLMLVVFVPVLFVSAQQKPQRRQSDRPMLNNLNKMQKPSKPNVDLSAEPSVAPSEECDANEFMLKRKDFQGKVVELTFDRVSGLKQTENGYTARVTFEEVRGGAGGVTLLIPNEGLELFEDYATSNDPLFRRQETVLVEVLGANVTRAVGTRYRKSKPEGERYTW